MEKAKADRLNESVANRMDGALVGVDLVGIIQLAAMPAINWRLWFAACCFALSLPLLSLRLISRLMVLPVQRELDDWIWAVGTLHAVAGVGALLFQTSMVAGSVFVGVFFFSFALLVYKLHREGRTF